ncbi:MAG TPA: hypothetical protein VFI62_02135 [Burkholderiales bacterium]|nr:hypothetical protein [Burkholderiales bacterium]
MIRSFYAIPAMLCVTAALVTAQAPAGDKPASNPPAVQQPAAQQPPATPKPTTPPPSAQAPARPSESMAANKATYTGCLKPGTTAGTWILESAEVAAKAGAAPSAVGTSGASKTTFTLEPAATVNLTPHANHKVEVVGIVSPAKAGADASPAGAQAPKQQFSVESLKMVSATCP